VLRRLAKNAAMAVYPLIESGGQFTSFSALFSPFSQIVSVLGLRQVSQ